MHRRPLPCTLSGHPFADKNDYMRFLSPIILYTSAAFVFWYNGRGGDDVLIFPFITAIWPAAAGNPEKLSHGTIALISGVATLLLIKNLIVGLRRKPNQD